MVSEGASMLNRREILQRIAATGGITAAAMAMQSMGLFGSASATPLPKIPSDLGKGKCVLILGAGIGGLVTALGLEQAGFDVTILEARQRVGGRVWTIRDGDSLEMIGEDAQTAHISNGQYFNAGAARIPSWHQGILGYARKFKVPLEVEVNSSRSAYVIAEDGSRLRMRTAVNDMRGHLSELLSKAVNQGSLDQNLSAQDKELLLPFLIAYGDLNAEHRFAGTERSGFSSLPGAGTSSFARAAAPISLDELLSNQMLPATLFEDNIFMQATMFQPVGGMDQIARGIATGLRRPPLFGAEVIRIRQSEHSAAVTCKDMKTGQSSTLMADFLVCTIPFNTLSRIESNFSRPVAAAIADVPYDNAAKVAFDAPRFWEDDQIYGGISFVGGETGVIWYPSANMHSGRGLLVACYSVGENSARFERRPIAEQIAMARAAVEKTHPGHGRDCQAPLVVNWSKVKYSEGPWPAWGHKRAGLVEGDIDTPGFRLLCNPDGRIYFAGAAMSQTTGWQEGAVNSAHETITAIAERTSQLALTSQANHTVGIPA